MNALTTATNGGSGAGFYIVAVIAAVVGLLMIVFRTQVAQMAQRRSGREDSRGHQPSARLQAAGGVGFLVIAVVMLVLAQTASK